MGYIDIEHFVVGEKPPATNCRYEDENGDLITSISGATLTAKVSINGGTESDIDCTNNDDGTFTINWPKGSSDSAFTESGVMRIRILVETGDYSYYLKPYYTVKITD